MKTNIEQKTASLLEALITPLVDDPFALLLENSGDVVEFAVELSPADLQKLGGSKGKTCNSLTIIVKAAGIQANAEFTLSFRSNAVNTIRHAESLL